MKTVRAWPGFGPNDKLTARKTASRCMRSAWVVVLAIAAVGSASAVETLAPEGISPADWSAIQVAREQAIYRPVPSQDGGWNINNPQHGFKAHFATDGSTTLESTQVDRLFTISMRLSSVGYDDGFDLDAPPERMEPTEDGVKLAWSVTLHEWWINSPDGLEQWFELSEPPARKKGEQPLRLGFSLDSSLEPSIENNALVLTSAQSDLEIRYARLKAWDATGRELPATMALDGAVLRLVVDDAGAVYPVTIDPTYEQAAYLKASNNDEFGVELGDSPPGEWFGFNVAVADDTVVVGVSREDSSATGINGEQDNNDAREAGAAYVFVRDGSGNWGQQAYLKASNTDALDFFGSGVAVSGDTIVVGAPGEDSSAAGVDGDQSDNSAFSAGAAYVFVRDGAGTWSQQAYLKASNAESGDFFGRNISISGNTIVVGAIGEESSTTGVDGDQGDNSASNAGAAYVFVRDGIGGWAQQGYFKASNTEAVDSFGSDVAVSGDTIVVAAFGEDSSANGINGDQGNNDAQDAGAAYVFVRDGSGSWEQQAYLKASNTDADDGFGRDVAVSGDTIAVGASGEDSSATGIDGDEADNSASGAGAAYVFVRDGDGNWSQQAYLKASNADAGDGFGTVDINEDRLVVGALGEDSSATGIDGDEADSSALSAGAAYVFLRDGTGAWTQQAYLKASNTNAGDRFGGGSVAVSADVLVLGAFFEDSNATGIDGNQADNSIANAGAAYVFDFLDTGPPQLSLNIEDCPSKIWLNDRLDFEVTVNNTGAGAARDLVVSLELPSELSFELDDSGGLCAQSGDEIVCLVDQLGAGASIRIGFRTNVATAPGGPNISTFARLESMQTDPIEEREDTQVQFDLIFMDGGERCVF